MSTKAAGKKREASPSLDIDLEEEVDMQDEGPVDKAEGSSSKAKKSTSSGSGKKKRRTASVPGIIYISRLPPGMTPQKVKHLMSRWGDVGKIYAQKRDAPTGYDPNASKKKKERHQAANYSEAWVEFLDKSVAKTVAKMLNAEVIGGKKGDKWRDDIWTMKYLSGFKWEMLGEQVAYERQAHQARLRNEITQSRAVQGEYLRNVELARVLDKRRAKKAAAEGDDEKSGNSEKSSTSRPAKTEVEGDKKHKATYRQREVVDRAAGLEKKGMDSVLGSVFG